MKNQYIPPDLTVIINHQTDRLLTESQPVKDEIGEEILWTREINFDDPFSLYDEDDEENYSYPRMPDLWGD